MRYAIILLAGCICILANTIQAASSDSDLLSKMIDDTELNIQLMDTSAAPSSIVGGTVNVITGSYIESECDLVIPGANPLIVQRSFNSGNNEKGNLCHGWDLNLPSEVIIPSMQQGSFKATVKDRGANLVFETKSGKEKKEMSLYHKHLRYGVTNCASGVLSSRTNIKNKRLHCKSEARHCKLYEESGEILIYSATNGSGGDTRDYSVKEIQMPSGCSFTYDYEKKTFLKRVTSRGSRGNKLSHIKWKYTNEFDEMEFFLDPQEFSLVSSDGRSISYKFQEQESVEGLRHRFCLQSVMRNFAPDVTYEYRNVSKHKMERMVKKSFPENRYLKVQYYEEGKNRIGSDIIYLSSRKDSRQGRVAALYAPVGEDATPIMIWSFKYQLHKGHHSNKPFGGKTEVTDALGHRKIYSFSDEQRLTSMKHFLDDGHLYREEVMAWQESGNEKTFLMERGVTDGQGLLLQRRDYKYDDRGNVLRERFWGNLTGLNSVNATWKEYRNVEKYVKTYTHTGAGLIKTENDGSKKIQYAYLKGTDLVTLKLVSNSERICERYHYGYDANRVLINEIIDDGDSPDIKNFSGVTQRNIKKIYPTSLRPIGLPEVAEEWFLNLTTGQEELISRLENSYSERGHLIRQNTYDSKGEFCFFKEWGYDAHGNVVKEIDPLGQVTTYQYDKNDNRIFQQTPNAEFYTLYGYDYANRLIRQEDVYVDGTVATQSYKYDYMGNRISSTDIYGNTTEYSYDEFGRLIKKINPSILDFKGELVSPVDKVAYDCMNNPTEKTDVNGCTTKTWYTAWGKPYLITYPDGSLESFVYSTDGVLVKSTAKNGSYTIYKHDYQQRCTSKKVYSASGELLYETSATYNAFHVLTETDASGSVTYYTYDRAGRKIKIRKNDAETIYVYDSLGREIECREILGDGSEDYIVKVKQYDFLNRIIEETLQDPSQNILQKATYSYDEMGNRNIITLYNEAGINLQQTKYDPRRLPIKFTDGLGNITTTYYDYTYYNSLGQKVAYKETVDALGNRDITIADAMGNVAVKMRKNSSGETTQRREFTYNEYCKIIRLVETVLTPGADDRLVVTEWGYDSCGRITFLIEAKGTSEVKHTEYTYTIAGEKKEIIKPDGTILRHIYDDLGRLVSFSSSDSSICYSYTYDLLNNPIRIDDEVHHITTTKIYDSNNRLISETLGNNLTICYRYDRLGRITLIELPDGTFQETRYSSSNISEVCRLTSNRTLAYSHRYTKHDLSGNIIEAQLAGEAGMLKIEYDLLGRPSSVQAPHWCERLNYDPVGNVIQRELEDDQGILELCYSYDDLYQLKSETGESSHQYQYDSLYNRTVKDEEPLELNALNQLLSNRETTYIYDLNGNLSQQIGPRAFSYKYDALDRLITVQTQADTIEYLYDSENRRLSKSSGSSGLCRYFYIGNCEVGCCNADGQVLEYRLLGQGKGAEIGAAVALEINGTLYIPLHDAQGSLVSLLNSDGHPVCVHRYTAFGEETSYGTTEINPWRFSSKRYDSETNFIYFGRRYYAPSTGRWVTPDPIGYDGGPNLYCYVGNTPLTHFDLFGLYDTNGMTICGFPGPSFKDMARTAMLIQSICDPVKLDSNPTVRESDLFLSSRDMFPHPAESFFVGTKTRDNRAMGYTNGMCTSRERAVECGQMLSDMSGGYRCDIVHNPSGGLMNDITRYAISSRSLIATNVIPDIHRTWENYFNNSPPDSRYLQFCHSEGVNNVRTALMSYDKERVKRIDVVPIAPSVYINRNISGNVDHYRSTHDIVPLIDSAGLARNRGTTHVLERHPEAHFWDHDCTSPTYENSIQEHINAHFNLSI